MITPTDVRRAAMDLLARREHGASELVTKLERRFTKSLARETKAKAVVPIEDFAPAGGVAVVEEAEGSSSSFADGSADGSSSSFAEGSLPADGSSSSFAEASAEGSAEGSDYSPEALRGLIEVEVQKLTDSGLQSDSRLAESFVRARVNRGQGPMKIRMELRQKGVRDAIIDMTMQAAEVDWQALAVDVAAKKFASSDIEDPRVRAKRQRFLQQRGFSFEQISSLNYK